MRRQFNVKAAIIIVGSVLLLGAGVAALHSYQVVRHAEVFLRQAEKAAKDNRPDQALRYFGLYLTYKPGDVDARAEYGLALEKHGDYEKALLNLDQVLRRDPTRKNVRFSLIRCLVAMRRLSEAVDHAEKLLPDWENKGELEHILGWCCEALGRDAEAAEWFGKAIALDPKLIESYALLADLLRRHPDWPGKSADVMDALVQANPEAYRAYLLRYRSRLQSAGDDDAKALALAEKDLQRAIELAANEPDVVLAAADSSVRRGRTEEARAALARGLAAHPHEVALYKVLAQLELDAGLPEAARSVLTQGVLKAPRDWDLRVMLADLLIDLKKPALAEKQVAELRKLGPKSPVPDYFQARLLMDKRQWPDAITLLERTRGRVSGTLWSAQIQLQLGRCYQQIGDAEQQLIAFELAAKERPELSAALAGQGSALLALGRLDEAEVILKKAAAGAWIRGRTWTDRHLRKPRPNPAVPGEVWTDLARCLMLLNLRRGENERRWDDVDWALEQAVRRLPSSVDIVILRAEIDMAQKNFDTARKRLEQARTEFPQSGPLECALADLLLQQNDLAGALAVLDRADKIMGPSADIRQARLRLWGRQAGAHNRELVRQLGEGLEIFTQAERARLLRELAETWVRLGDPGNAEHFWRRLIDEQPSDLRARLSLLDLSLQQGKVDAARQIVEDLRKVEGEKGACWHYGAAALLLAESLGPGPRLEKARKHLAECYRTRSDWSRLPLLDAQIDEAEGRFADAVKHYTIAFDLGERSPRLVYRLVKLLQERREFITAQKIFTRFEQQLALNSDMARLGAELALANNDGKRALALGRLVVPAASKDYRDYLWLARLYQADGQLKQAEEQLEWAVSLAPHAPEVWVANLQHLALSGRLEATARLLNSVRQKVPAKQLAYTLARCHEVLGRFDEAEEYYRQALAQRPKDFALWAAFADFCRRSDQPAKAVPWLEKLLDPAGSVPYALQAPARQQLALLLAGTGQKDGVKRALELLSTGFYPDDERTRYLVQGFDPAGRDDAMKSFEKIREGLPISAEELFYFAKVQLAADDTAKANSLLRDLVTSNPDNPQYLAEFTRSQLQAGDDAKGAALCLQKLQQLEPDSRRTKELTAQVRAQKK